jgi:hypothetical protein
VGLRWFVIGVLSLKGEALGLENWLDFPHLPSRGGDTRIFWTRIHLTQRMRLPLKESRMKFGEPTELRRKSGVRGTRFASLITGKDRSLGTVSFLLELVLLPWGVVFGSVGLALYLVDAGFRGVGGLVVDLFGSRFGLVVAFFGSRFGLVVAFFRALFRFVVALFSAMGNAVACACDGVLSVVAGVFHVLLCARIGGLRQCHGQG